MLPHHTTLSTFPNRRHRANGHAPPLPPPWALEAARTLWLHGEASEHCLAARLRAKLAAAGCLVYTLEVDPAPGEACRSFDLIIYCTGAQSVGKVAAAVQQIRVFNRAPLVVLTPEEHLDWALVLLPAGADVVLAFDTPEAIFVARCVALLQRWIVV
jgi:hypothetical protein